MTEISVATAHELAATLIRAQDAALENIAHQLHDHIGQQLAGLSLALSGLRRRLAEHDRASLETSLTSLQQQTIDLAGTVGRLSHELHPGSLQQFGLAAALTLRCEDFQRQHGIAVTVTTTGSATVAPEVALSLFRSAEEALHRVATHTDARAARISLSLEPDRSTLTISDDGSRKTAEPNGQPGTALNPFVNEARARLLRGLVQIETEPGRGTTVTIVIPDATT